MVNTQKSFRSQALTTKDKLMSMKKERASFDIASKQDDDIGTRFG